MKFLVLEANKEERNRQLQAQGIKTLSHQYSDILSELEENCEITVAYPNIASWGFSNGERVEDFDGILCTGSSMHIYEDTPQLRSQLELVRKVLKSRVPFLGVCWGLQIGIVGMGGSVKKNPRGDEFFLSRNVMLTNVGIGHAMYTTKPPCFDVLTWHSDIVENIPLDAEVLASNPMTDIQSLAVESEEHLFWGLQYHPEFNLDLLSKLILSSKELENFFISEEQRQLFSDELTNIHEGQDVFKLCWKYGIDKDMILNDFYRLAEIKNWLEYGVKKYV